MCKGIAIAVMLMAAPVVMATAITINPSADALVVSGGGKAGNNYGGSGGAVGALRHHRRPMARSIAS